MTPRAKASKASSEHPGGGERGSASEASPNSVPEDKSLEGVKRVKPFCKFYMEYKIYVFRGFKGDVPPWEFGVSL